MTQDYKPGLVRLNKLSGSALLSWTFRLGDTHLGQTTDTRTGIAISNIDLTDGFTVGDGGELSIDPMTGSATMSEFFGPDVTDTVIGQTVTPLIPGDRFEITYGTAVVQLGVVGRVEVHLEASGYRWLRKSTYQLSGLAGLMLDQTEEWPFLPEESSLQRLGRFFTVDTSALTVAQVIYLNTVLMPGTNAGSSTRLDLAREFSEATGFPVRSASLTPSEWRALKVVPAVTFRGTPPTAIAGNAETWASTADFARDEATPTRAEGIEVVKNYTGFISGVETVAAPAVPLGQFRLAGSRLGAGYAVPIGLWAPAVLDVFGTRLVAAKIQHSFTSRDYRSALELVAPKEVT